jgi:hypothetical protein
MDQYVVQVAALNFLIFYHKAAILVWEDIYHKGVDRHQAGGPSDAEVLAVHFASEGLLT